MKITKTSSNQQRERINTPIGPGYIVGRSPDGDGGILAIHYRSEVTWSPTEFGLPFFYKYWTPERLQAPNNPV